MGNKTLIPAFRAAIGNIRYYVCKMTYGEIARRAGFLHEQLANQELGMLIQRGISTRTKGITEYLLKSNHRFLGGIVVAAWGGEPKYTAMSMEDPDGMLQGLDREFGVLTFDGSQQYFVLDGQHRLRAIKDAMRQNPNLGTEDICVLIVTHWNNPEGRMRTRRLFSNINRNAQQTALAENIALDEDDGFAILTRRMLDDHDFLKVDGRVKVITYAGEDGELKLAGGNIAKTDARALTTITVLYDVLRYLGLDLPGAMSNKASRPFDEVLDESFAVLTKRFNDLLEYCGNIRARLEAAGSARDVRAPKNAEGDGHAFMRPVIQKAVARVAMEIVQQKRATWDEVMHRLSELKWEIGAPPWEAVYSVEGSKMLVGKDNTSNLGDLLHAHLAPASMQAIRRARKGFKDVRGKAYPISEEELATRLPSEDVPLPEITIELPTEISADVEAEAGAGASAEASGVEAVE